MVEKECLVQTMCLYYLWNVLLLLLMMLLTTMIAVDDDSCWCICSSLIVAAYVASVKSQFPLIRIKLLERLSKL